MSYKLKTDTNIGYCNRPLPSAWCIQFRKDLDMESIYDVAERLLLKYPLLQNCMNDNIGKIHNLLIKVWSLESAVWKLYPATAVPLVVSKAAAAKLPKSQWIWYRQNFRVYTKKADAGTIADFYCWNCTRCKTKKLPLLVLQKTGRTKSCFDQGNTANTQRYCGGKNAL